MDRKEQNGPNSSKKFPKKYSQTIEKNLRNNAKDEDAVRIGESFRIFHVPGFIQLVGGEEG